MKDNLKYLHDFILGQIRMSNWRVNGEEKGMEETHSKKSNAKKNLISILKYGTKQLIEWKEKKNIVSFSLKSF